MAKVTNPLLSGDARGNFGKQMIFRRGGVVTKYFSPKNPNTIAQVNHRQAFKEYYMASLTQAQADLLYALIVHDHDERYPLIAHTHKTIVPTFSNLTATPVPASTSYIWYPYLAAVIAGTANIVFPTACSLLNFRIVTTTAQPASGSMVCTMYLNNATTALTFTVAANAAAGNFNDLTHKVSVASMSAVRFVFQNNATGNSASIQKIMYDVEYG